MIKGIIRSFVLKQMIKRNSNNICTRSTIQSILVVRLDEIGDMVLMSPFLRELRRNYPEAEITLVVKPAVYNLVELCPYVNHIKIFKRPASGRGMFFRLLWAARKFARDELNGSYDLALVPRFDADASYGAGLIAFFSRACRRVGFASRATPMKEVSDIGYDELYTELVPIRIATVHEVERNLDVLRYLKCHIENKNLEVWTENKDGYDISSLIVKREMVAKPCIALFLSAGGEKKEWGVRNYIELLQKIKKIMPLSIILLGDAANTRDYANELKCVYNDCIDLVGATTLRQTIEILKQCDCYLGGDTGPMHLAAACGLKGVAIFLHVEGAGYQPGLFPPERFGPWKSEINVIRPQRDILDNKLVGEIQLAQDCKGITVDSVFKAMCAVLATIK